jgi:hypothetical protein
MPPRDDLWVRVVGSELDDRSGEPMGQLAPHGFHDVEFAEGTAPATVGAAIVATASDRA